MDRRTNESAPHPYLSNAANILHESIICHDTIWDTIMIQQCTLRINTRTRFEQQIIGNGKVVGAKPIQCILQLLSNISQSMVR